MAHNDNPGQWWLAQEAAEKAAAEELAAEAAKKAEAKPAASEVKPEAEAEPAKPEGDAAKPASKVETAEEPAAEPTLEEAEAALAAVRELRTMDKKRYLSEEVQAEERRLIEVVEQAKAGLQFQAAGQETVDAILGEAPDGEALDASFTEVFNGLDEAAQDAVRLAIASPVDPVRPASDADIELFASVPVQAEAVKEWGREAPRRLAILRERTLPMLQASPELGAWFDGLPKEQAMAILNALAR